MPQDNFNSTEKSFHVVLVHILWSLIIRTDNSGGFHDFHTPHTLRDANYMADPAPFQMLMFLHMFLFLFKMLQMARLKNANSSFSYCSYQYIPAAG